MARTGGALREKPPPSAGGITQQKRAEEALRESEERFRNVLENSLDMIYRLSLETGTYDYSSPSSKQVIGYSPEELLALGVEQARSLVHPDDIQRLDENVIQLLTQALGQGVPHRIEYRFKHKELGYRWVSDTRSLVYDERNVPVAVVGNLTDITERKRAEETLRDSEERYRQLFDSISDAVIVYSSEGRFLDCNATALQRLGYTREEFLRLGAADIVHPDFHQTMKGNQKRIWAGEPTVVESVHRCKDGRSIPVEVNARRVEYNGKPAILAVVRDITERKRAEEELRESEDHYRTIFESAPVAIFHSTPEGKITSANPAIARIFGYESPDELMAVVNKSGVAKALYVHPEKRPPAVDIALAQEGWVVFENQYRRKDGNVITGHVLFRAVRNPDGTTSHLEGFIEDITERKRAEEELVKYHEHLEELVEERTGELSKANKQLQQEVAERKQAEEKLERLYQKETELRQELEEEMKKRVEFTRALAHELKTPLTPMVMSSELLTSELKDETLLRVARNISRGAANLNSRIDELLDLAREEMGMLQIKPERVDVLGLLGEVVEDVAPVPSSRGQSLISKLPPTLPSVRADRVRLRQIVLNLLNNAFKFTPDGGEITLRARQEDGDLVVEVQDTGRGIAEEEQQRLFEPYHRVDADRECMAGLGLGLALCKTLVELHGGRIWVESAPGKGSTFGFSLPLERSSK